MRARLEKGLSRLAGASNRDRSSLRRQDRHEGEDGEGEEFSHDEEVFRCMCLKKIGYTFELQK